MKTPPERGVRSIATIERWHDLELVVLMVL
jgi:hypothetical protein